MRKNIKQIGKSYIIAALLILTVCSIPHSVLSDEEESTFDMQESVFIIEPSIGEGEIAGQKIEQWSAYIEHAQGESFDWWINTTPDIGNASGMNMHNGSISTNLGDLEYGDNFTINITLHSASENKNTSYNLSIVNVTKNEFLSDGSWTAPENISSIDLLVVAGGGGGGGADGMGGGAGGLIYKEGYSVTPGNTYDIAIGDGGAGGGGYGEDGENSSFGTIEAWGGGGGAYNLGTTKSPGRPGGSGGGSYYQYSADLEAATGYYAHDNDPDTYGTDGGYSTNRRSHIKGGGAASAGNDGGDGLVFWGTEYCQGGFNANGGANTGNGGNGKYYNGNGYPGGSGIVIVAYPETNTYNIAPTQDSLKEEAQPTCSIDTYHPTEATISFAHNISGEWHIEKTIHNVSNGTYTWEFDEATALNKTYWWKVYVDDGTNNVTSIYSFKTRQIGLSGLLIENNTHIHRDEAQWWNITIADEAGQFNWSIETSPDIGSASGTNEGNGTKSCRLLTPKEYLHFDEDVGSSVSCGDTYSGTKEAIKLDQTELVNNDGNYLTSVRIYARPRSDCDLEIWEGGTKPDGYCCVYGNSAGIQLLEQELDLSDGTKWYDIALDSPIKIDASSSYWIVMDNHDNTNVHTVYRDSGCVPSAFPQSNWLARPYTVVTSRVCWLDANERWGDRTQAWNIRAGISESAIEYSTTYTVYVNVTGSERNETYTFTTQSGPEDKIHVVLSPQATADIKLNRTTWEPGVGFAGNATTGLHAFNLDNNGSVSVDVEMYVINSTAWHPGQTPGHDRFNLSINDGSGWNIILNEPEQFIANLGYNENQDFGLQLYKPTSTSTADNQTVTLVFEATAR